jgi:hypothetical protein
MTTTPSAGPSAEAVKIATKATFTEHDNDADGHSCLCDGECGVELRRDNIALAIDAFAARVERETIERCAAVCFSLSLRSDRPHGLNDAYLHILSLLTPAPTVAQQEEPK